MTSDMTSPKNAEAAFKARAPRVPITELHRIFFTQSATDHSKRWALINVSVTGIGILKNALATLPNKDELLKGYVIIENRGYPAKVKIVHTSGPAVGGLFQESPPELQKALRNYFKVELAALTTMKINPKYHKSEPDGTAHWIHGDTADLFYVERDEKVLRFHMTFLGNYFEGSKGKPLTAGQLIPEGDVEPHKGAELVSLEESISPEMIDLGLKFVSHVPHLPPEHLAALKALIQTK